MNIKELRDQVNEYLNLYRSLLMDSVEAELGNTKGWQFTRGRLLRLLGDQGLQGKINSLFEMEAKSDRHN